MGFNFEEKWFLRSSRFLCLLRLDRLCPFFLTYSYSGKNVCFFKVFFLPYQSTTISSKRVPRNNFHCAFFFFKNFFTVLRFLCAAKQHNRMKIQSKFIPCALGVALLLTFFYQGRPKERCSPPNKRFMKSPVYDTILISRGRK